MCDLNILRALREVGHVEVVGLEGIGLGPSPVTCSEFEITYSFRFNLSSNHGLSDKIKWTVDPKRQYPNGLAVEDEAVRGIFSRLASFDLIWFSTMHAADMFPVTMWPNSVLDVDDLQSSHGRTSLKIQSSVWERCLAFRKVFVWKRREKLLGQRFSLLCTCSDEDRRYLKSIGVQVPIHVIPNAFERPTSEPVRISSGTSKNRVYWVLRLLSESRGSSVVRGSMLAASQSLSAGRSIAARWKRQSWHSHACRPRCRLARLARGSV